MSPFCPSGGGEPIGVPTACYTRNGSASALCGGKAAKPLNRKWPRASRRVGKTDERRRPPPYTEAQVRDAGKRELIPIGVAAYGNPGGHMLLPHPG